MKTTIALTVLAIAATLLPGTALELQRGGEPWRIVTCQFTHWTYEQLAWDGLAFAALGVACARRNRATFHATLLASVILVPLAVMAFAPGVTAYRGLSGIDSALFALLICGLPRRYAVLLGAAFFGKVALELATGTLLFVHHMGNGVVGVPVAHVAGAVIGCVVARVPLTRPFDPPSLRSASLRATPLPRD